MLHADICIAGAGIIGLSLALEIQSRNLSVVVIDADHPMREASIAAAGMLAAEDPHNPAELLALSRLSVALYPEFLNRLEALGGVRVPFQTSRTLQMSSDFREASHSVHGHGSGLGLGLAEGFDSLLLHAADDDATLPPHADRLAEHSLDPRQLAPALLAAVEATPIQLLSQSPVASTRSLPHSVLVDSGNQIVEAAHVIDCTGAWASDQAFRVEPIKGQMLAVALPATFQLKVTVRSADIYIVPRTIGPNAGRAIIGATIEEAGFDKAVHAAQIEGLRQQAIALLPQLATAKVLESWAGLRPAAPDRLPLLGPHPAKPRHWVATGHYRNGILLAPASARVMARMLLNEPLGTQMDTKNLEPFAPGRSMVRQS